MMMTTSSNDNWIRRFIVSDPRKHRKGFTIYKVTSIVYPKQSPEAATTLVVWKRYSDFKKLHRELQSKHKKLHLTDQFPSFVKAKFFGRFEEEVIEERRKCATTLLEFVGDHPPLFTSTIFVKFFESGYSDSACTESATENIVPPVQVSVENGNSTDLKPVDNHPITLPDTKPGHSGTKKNESDDGPLLILGGTWQFPQAPDSISLSSRSSDEHSYVTDTDSAISGVSGVNSPLQTADLQLFDPLHPSSVCTASLQQPSGYKWLLPLAPSSPLGDSDDKTAPTQCGGGCYGSGARTVELEARVSKTFVTSQSEIARNLNVELQVDLYQHIGSSQSSKPSHMTKEQKVQNAVATSFLMPNQPQPTLVPDVHAQDYVSKADYNIEKALRHEAAGEYEAALALYKAGIGCLLRGVQDDTDAKRKRIVREKTSKCLLAAEKVCKTHLGQQNNSSSKLKVPESQLCRPLSELKAYKVLGIINQVLLVLNVLEDQCYVVKVLHKSPCPISQNKHSIIPTNVPYMVLLYRYFETESSIYLVLHHASGGRLWDHVSSYFHSLPPTPVHLPRKENVYLGKKLIQVENIKTETGSSPPKDLEKSVAKSTGISALADSNSSNDHSYVELIRDYTSAKCGQSPQVPSQENGNVLSVKDMLLDISDNLVDYKDTYNTVNPIITNYNMVSTNDILSTPERMEGGSEYLADSVDIDVSRNTENSTRNSDTLPDLYQNSNYSFSWRNLETVDTADLVENAQRLIQSVSETLLRTETEVNSSSSVKHSSESDVCGVTVKFKELSEKNSHCNLPVCDKTEEVISDWNIKSHALKRESSPKSYIHCKSKGDSSSNHMKTQERRRSTSRRCSTTARPSIERRFSSDDLFEGRVRTTSGSLDRGHQWTRLQNMLDHPKPRLPENTIRQWAAELLVCVDSLHRWGIICRDLRPENVLLGDNGHILLTYMSRWVEVDSVANTEAIEWLYTAPEVSTIFDLTPAADWWSFGALLFELASGKSLLSCHPGGIQSHTILNIPEYVSEEAQSLIRELLRYSPQERLGSGITGSEELKSHPFFSGVDWDEVIKNSTL